MTGSPKETARALVKEWLPGPTKSGWPTLRRTLVEMIATALRAAEARGREAAWQPIETAPKDGTRVLLGWADRDYVTIGMWGPDGWENVLGEVFAGAFDWQPLPAPPSAIRSLNAPQSPDPEESA